MLFKCMTLCKEGTRIDVTHSKRFHRMPVSEIIENATTKIIETSDGVREVKVMDVARLILSKYDAVYDRTPVDRLGVHHAERRNHVLDMSKWFSNYTTIATAAQLISPMFTQDYANSRDARNMKRLVDHAYGSVDVFAVREGGLLNRYLRKNEIEEFVGLIRSISDPEPKQQSRLTGLRHMPQFLNDRFFGLIR